MYRRRLLFKTMSSNGILVKTLQTAELLKELRPGGVPGKLDRAQHIDA